LQNDEFDERDENCRKAPVSAPRRAWFRIRTARRRTVRRIFRVAALDEKLREFMADSTERLNDVRRHNQSKLGHKRR
jgi:hypothetical protein